MTTKTDSKPGGATLLAMIDTDVDDDTLAGNMIGSPDSNQENRGPPKKRGRTKANAKRFTKAPSKRSNASSAATKADSDLRTMTAHKRAPLKEHANVPCEADSEDVNGSTTPVEADATEEGTVGLGVVETQQVPLKDAAKALKRTNSNQQARKEKDGEFEYTPKRPRIGSKAAGTHARQHQRALKEKREEKVIPETQLLLDAEDYASLDEGRTGKTQRLPQASLRQASQPRSNSQQRTYPISRSRAGSASDTERTIGDPAIRRRLGDMTRKFENLDLKYRNLHEIGVKEAEANFERLKLQSETRAKAANELISSLRRDLATQKSLVSDTDSIHHQISARDAELTKAKLYAEQLSSSLAEAQNEIKALQAKLANSRNAVTNMESNGSRTPGSALRARHLTNKSTPSTAEAAQATQTAQLKEDLYSDLTGLIIRGVEISSESDVYDCLQTGRNGTLHFKLSIAKETEESYDETEFQYTPRIDENRDRDLITLLPEYLTDEITFSRTNAAMFYGRVVETLTKRRKVEEG